MEDQREIIMKELSHQLMVFYLFIYFVKVIDVIILLVESQLISAPVNWRTHVVL